MKELAVDLAGISLEHPLMNAAGTDKTLKDVRRIAPSPTSAVMVGSFTFKARSGNEGNIYWSSSSFSLNSLGLPNPGAEYYRKHLSEMAAIVHAQGKKLFASIAGFTRLEYEILTELASGEGADAVELNLACPNVWDGGGQKGILCFYPEEVAELLDFVGRRLSGFPVSVKLSPFSDPFQLQKVAAVISKSELVKMVTAVNCFPNTLALDGSGNPRTNPGGGLAGLGGPAMKPIGLGQVKQLRDALPEHIPIIGVGGIKHGGDIIDYQRVGAAAVQINTALVDEGVGVFGRILGEYAEVLD